MDVEMLREAGEDGGGFMGFWIKGHVDVAEFHAACLIYAEHDLYDWDRREGLSVSPWMVRQAWWRCVPMGPSEPGVFYADAKPGSRGAFPVTYVNTSEIGIIRWEAEKRWDDVTLWEAAADYSLDSERRPYRAFSGQRCMGALPATTPEHARALVIKQVGEPWALTIRAAA